MRRAALRTALGILLACASAAAAWAQGGGIALYEVSTPNLGEAYAGQAALADDAATAFTNPAGMARLSGRHMLFGGQLGLLSMKFNPATPSESGSTASTTLIIPAVYFVQSLGRRVRFGFSFNAPFGSALDYGHDWAGRYFIEDIQLAVTEARPTLAFRINRWISIGGGLSLQRAGVTKAMAVRNVLDPGFPDGSLAFALHDWAVGANAGILVEAGARTRFGVTYRSGMDFDLQGRATAAGIGPAMAALLAPMLSQPTCLHLPAGANVSMLHAFTRRLTVLADGGWTNWRHFGERASQLPDGSPAVTDGNWRDTWRAAAGLRYRLSPRLALQTGASYDSSPVADWNRTPEVPAGRQVRVAAGVKYALRPTMTLGVSYSYLDLGKPEIRNLQDPLAGTLAGRYSSARLPFLALTLALSPGE
ncbi:MAG: outer membrane protein transport protein [Acidobacteriia bacterium]|nr:outer membrane protein transport protein [Terriglobia bacterium]